MGKVQIAGIVCIQVGMGRSRHMWTVFGTDHNDSGEQDETLLTMNTVKVSGARSPIGIYTYIYRPLSEPTGKGD